MKILIFLLAGFIFFINTNAREIGIAPVKIWTDNKEIQNPIGFSIYYFQPIGKFGIKFEYVYAKNSRSYYGFLNGGFLLRKEDYIEDSISSNSIFRAIEFSLQFPKLFEIFQNHLNIGAGITFDKFTGEKIGLSSGREFNSDEDKFGIFYSVSISREKIFKLPLKVEVLFKHKALSSGSYAADAEQPFVGTIDVKVLQINFAYIF
jgi:hypothetical protein